MARLPRALAASLLLPALAAWGGDVTDRGTALANDPYEGNTALTTGRIAGFRTLYGAPDALAEALVPTDDASGRGDLTLTNDRMSWAEVTVNGHKVGVIGPYGRGTIGNVAAGDYAYTLTFPTGYVLSATASVVAAPRPEPATDMPSLPQTPPSETP